MTCFSSEDELAGSSLNFLPPLVWNKWHGLHPLTLPKFTGGPPKIFLVKGNEVSYQSTKFDPLSWRVGAEWIFKISPNS